MNTPNPLIPTDGEVYLGDGLFASFDGWTLWLRAPREDGDHRVALDPYVWRALRGYLNDNPNVKQFLEGEKDG
jgi:hypothetical protein